MKKHIITEAEYNAVKEASRKNKNKRIDKRLQVIVLRYEGKKDCEIAEKLGYSRKRVSQLCAEFKKIGVEEYIRQKYGGNHRSLTDAEESEILNSFAERAERGEIICVQEIKAALDKKLNKDTGRGYIYICC